MNRLKIYEGAKEFSKTELEPLLNQLAEKALNEMKKVYKNEDDLEATEAWAEYVGNILKEEAEVISSVMGDYSKDLKDYEEVSDEEPETPEVPEEEAAAEAPPEEGAAPEVPADLAAELEAAPEAEATPEIPATEVPAAPKEEEEAPPLPEEEEEEEKPV